MAKINPQSTITATSLNISDLLSKSTYCIPDYQRDFVWKWDEIEQLWKDLTQHYKANSSADEIVISPKAYFLGAMVVLKQASAASPTFEVIDGQQRLIALSCIASILENLANAETLPGPANQLGAMVGHFTSGAWATRVSLFSPELQEFLRNSLLEKKNPSDRKTYWDTDASALALLKPKKSPAKNIRAGLEGLAEAASKFFNECKTSAERKRRLNAFSLLFAECVIVLRIEADDHSTAYNLFESLNNRGMPLNQADLVKNELLKCSATPAERTQISDNWNTVRDTLANYDLELPDFLHYSYMSRVGAIKAGELFASAKEKIAKSALTYSQDLADDVVALDELITGNGTKWHARTNDKLKDIWEVLRVKLGYVALLAAHRQKGAAKDDFDAFVKLVVNFGFRHLKVMEGSVSVLSNAMAEMARKIDNGDTFLNIANQLEKLCPDRMFIEEFESISFPQTKLGYFSVYYLELEMLKGTGVMPTPHGQEQNLEHIMPKTPTVADWPIAYAMKTKDKAEYRELVWRIGNLLPLPESINKSIKNKSISHKISNASTIDYAHCGLESPKGVAGFLGAKTEWTAKEIAARQKHLASKYAAAAWALK